MRRFLPASGMAANFGLPVFLALFVPMSGIRMGPDDGWTCSQAAAEEPDFTDTPSNPTLKDTLAKGLKARLPEEFAFVDRVVKMVDHGRLSREMVQSTFLWARKKNVHQFQYFEHGLRLRAQEVGISL